MKHKILIPTDFSKNATHALHYAIELYKNDTCIFYLLNVFLSPINFMENILKMEPGSELYETAKLSSENGLAKTYDMIAMTEYENPKHEFKTMSVFNDPIEAIKNAVDQKDIEMIIMGTKGETHSRATAFGSTAIYVMEKVRNCPVIVVPQKAKIKLPKEIVFPTNYKTNYKRRELNYLIHITKKSNASIVVLHIREEHELDKTQKENKQLLEDILEGNDYKFHDLSQNNIMSSINIFVESRGSDMVAFTNKKHTFFGSILTNTLVKEITFYLNIPLLVMHDLRN
ncbi:universal stress protein [Psychroserpens burtonensis]|uniref:Universal stress protein n=1 Tax=Psychroserpens burtonensis TaxID=49278 RepID=A0A5C7B628_9FLAO|nr:universal stress protein [Psychroserpens burtonensis]TXE16718.1 universal stress protein [Psychroserpens burtonensis]